MKRITVLLLMFLYLIPSIGFSVNVHYCGGNIASISFFDGKAKCKCGNKKMKKDCCKDEKTTYQLDDEQQKTQQFFCIVVKVTDFQPAISTNLTFDYHTPLLSTEFDHSTHPPDDLKHPLYIRHCVFRI